MTVPTVGFLSKCLFLPEIYRFDGPGEMLQTSLGKQWSPGNINVQHHDGAGDKLWTKSNKLAKFGKERNL